MFDLIMACNRVETNKSLRVGVVPDEWKLANVLPKTKRSIFGSQIWAPQSVALVKRMKSLQRRATKYILNLPFRCDTTYNGRRALLDLLPLCYWHEFLDMVTFYKLTHGIMTIDNNLLQPSPN